MRVYPSIRVISGSSFIPTIIKSQSMFVCINVTISLLLTSSKSLISDISLLKMIYPENVDCKILNKTTQGKWEIRTAQIKDIDQIKSSSVIFIPPSLASSSLEAFEELIAHLRSPQGCPWDRPHCVLENCP